MVADSSAPVPLTEPFQPAMLFLVEWLETRFSVVCVKKIYNLSNHSKNLLLSFFVSTQVLVG